MPSAVLGTGPPGWSMSPQWRSHRLPELGAAQRSRYRWQDSEARWRTKMRLDPMSCMCPVSGFTKVSGTRRLARAMAAARGIRHLAFPTLQQPGRVRELHVRAGPGDPRAVPLFACGIGEPRPQRLRARLISSTLSETTACAGGRAPGSEADEIPMRSAWHSIVEERQAGLPE